MTEEIEQRDALEAEVRSLRTEVAALRGGVVVHSEPRVYGPDSDASYFQDVALSRINAGPASVDAHARLLRYAAELDKEVALRSPEGRRAERVEREARRDGGRTEARAATSSTLAGFTTPQYLIEDWAKYRTPDKSFTDSTTQLPLPPTGLQINIPSFTGPATNTQQVAENTGVQITPSGGATIQVNLVTIAGQASISQQLFDRGGLSGLAFDKIVLAQILANQDAAMDLYVLNQALANAYTTNYSSSASWANFLADLALAREGLADTAGTRLTGTHLFTTSDQFGYWTRQEDDDHRPILTPDSAAIVMASQVGDPKWHSWTGTHLGPLRWHTDDNIPASGANTQLIVARPQEIFTFDGENYGFSYQETSARTLTVTVGLRTYAGAAVRFPKAIASISSNAYPLSNV